jgi:hypothetical protein
VGGDAFVLAEDDAAVVDEADFAHGFACAGDARLVVVEIEKLAGQRELALIFGRVLDGFVHEEEDFGAAVHAMEDFAFHREQIPDEIADARGFVVEQLGDDGDVVVDVGEFDLATLWGHFRFLEIRD